MVISVHIRPSVNQAANSNVSSHAHHLHLLLFVILVASCWSNDDDLRRIKAGRAAYLDDECDVLV